MTVRHGREPVDAAAILAQDAAHLLHPNGPIAFGDGLEPIVLVSGEGMRVRDVHGDEYVDAISGLMNVNAGYGRRELNAAATAAGDLGYGTLFFGRANVFAVRLAAKLAEITPAGIERFFFTLGGSDANDTAFRLVRTCNVAAGRPEKVNIVARRESYHGATLATLSAGGEAPRQAGLGLRMPGFVDVGQPRPGVDAVGELERAIAQEGAETIAAFVAEPVAYQAGMIVPPDDYWPRVRELCTRHDIVLIVDEVLTGLGRTGKMFAIEHWGVVPDVLVASKGLTSGYLPLGAVGLAADYAERVLDALGEGEGILGFTGTGHPACCAVALANIELIERERLVENARVVGDRLAAALERLRRRSRFVTGQRAMGLLAGLDLALAEPVEAGRDAAFCKAVVARLRERRVLVRPFGRTIAVAPPLVATPADVDEICAAIELAVEDVAAEMATPASR